MDNPIMLAPSLSLNARTLPGLDRGKQLGFKFDQMFLHLGLGFRHSSATAKTRIKAIGKAQAEATSLKLMTGKKIDPRQVIADEIAA